MKKSIGLLTLILLFASVSHAQIYKDFGIKLGTTIANQNYEFYGTTNYKFGFTGGIFKEIHMYQNLNLVSGINYAQKGRLDPVYETNETGQYFGTIYIHNNVNFFTTELYAKYNGHSGIINPYLIAGLRMDVFISAKSTFENHPGTLPDYPISNNKIFGGIIGLGISYNLKNSYSIFVESSYNPDFTYLGERDTEWGYKYTVLGNSFEIKSGIKF